MPHKNVQSSGMKFTRRGAGVPLVLPVVQLQPGRFLQSLIAAVRSWRVSAPSAARNLEAAGVAAILIAIVTLAVRFIEAEYAPAHLVLGYLIPTCLVALRYGGRPAVFTATAGMICAAFFLYSPVFSFYVAKPLDLAELGLVFVLAVASSQFIAAIFEPDEKISD
jgi:K+-sensing histidine kinase KdpD